MCAYPILELVRPADRSKFLDILIITLVEPESMTPVGIIKHIRIYPLPYSVPLESPVLNLNTDHLAPTLTDSAYSLAIDASNRSDYTLPMLTISVRCLLEFIEIHEFPVSDCALHCGTGEPSLTSCPTIAYLTHHLASI
jgi:hypothetical protein